MHDVRVQGSGWLAVRWRADQCSETAVTALARWQISPWFAPQPLVSLTCVAHSLSKEALVKLRCPSTYDLLGLSRRLGTHFNSCKTREVQALTH